MLCLSSALRYWRKGHCRLRLGPSGATAPCRLSSGVGRGGRSDHMIWVLQPLLGTSAQASSSPDFWEVLSCPALLSDNHLAIIRKGRRSGFSLSLDLVQPAVLPVLPTRWPHFLFPSLSPLLSSPVLHAGRAEFSCFTEFPCPSPPDGQIQILNTQL